MPRRRRALASVLAHVRRNDRVGACEIWTDLPPIAAAVERLPYHVRREIQRVRIDGREQEWCRAKHAIVGRTDRLRSDLLHLTRSAIIPSDFAAVDDIRIEWIGRRIAIFFDADGMPIAEGDLAIITATGDAGRTRLLLPAADSIWKRVVRDDVIERRRRLIVPRAPAVAAVHADDRALIARDDHRVRIVRIDPDAVVVVTAGRAPKRPEGLPAIH